MAPVLRSVFQASVYHCAEAEYRHSWHDLEVKGS